MQPPLSQLTGDLVTANRVHDGNLAGVMGIVLTAVGPDFLQGRMPVDDRTRQPFGLVHGGAFVVLAETLGSVASWLIAARTPGTRVAGIEVSASHLRAVREGEVTGRCRPVRIGRTLHVWSIEMSDSKGRPCCLARLTVTVSPPPGGRG